MRRYVKALDALIVFAQNEAKHLEGLGQIAPDSYFLADWEPSPTLQSAAIEIVELSERLRAIAEVEDAL